MFSGRPFGNLDITVALLACERIMVRRCTGTVSGEMSKSMGLTEHECHDTGWDGK